MGPHGPEWNASGVPLARTERDLARLVVRPLVTADHHPDPARNPLSLSNEFHPADRPPRNTPLLSHYVVTAPPSRAPGACHRAGLWSTQREGSAVDAGLPARDPEPSVLLKATR